MPDDTDAGAERRRSIGWGALGIAIFVAGWWIAAQRLGSFALPGPVETLWAAFHLFESGRALPAILDTGARVLVGFLLTFGLGTCLGLAAGLVTPFRHMVGPIVTMLLATPPIAWIVLAVLWFGPSSPAVIFTVVVSLATVPYLAAMNGVTTVDAKLLEITQAFHLRRWQRIRFLYGPHLLSHLSPAAITTFGLTWRVTLLAEVVGAVSGIGSGLARARSTLETADSFAWIAIVVALFLVVRFGVLGPLERHLQPWRKPMRSHGAGDG